MIPKIALIGRSNVGKSSLFNALTNSRNALIDQTLQTTRDRIYGYCLIKQNQFCIIDTAGICYLKKKENKNSIKYQSNQQTERAIQESDFLIFMVDAHIGITDLDFHIFRKIRKTNKPILLLINKIDNIDDISQITEFYSFGIKKIYQISILRKIGIDLFSKKMLIFWKKLNKTNFLIENKKTYFGSDFLKKKIKICVLGKPNVGKSSLINSLLSSNRIITHSTPGTTRGSVQVSLKQKNTTYIFTDTSGIRKSNKRKTRLEHISETKSLKIMKNSQMIIVVLDAYMGICSQDLFIINATLKSGSPFFIVFNKWDLIPKKKNNEIKKIINNRLNFIKNITYLHISALNRIGLKKIISQINNIFKESQKDFNSSYLTSVIHKAIIKNPLPMGATGKVIRLKYAHLSSKNPMLIIVHGTQTQNIPATYKKYLIRFLQKKLQILNTPIKIFFKNNINPYVNNKYLSSQK
ncbi:ribosome biogenesis GTPase Der [Buchnera aphidicola]|uniref:ribosome biogenesis GTPase Der n=1 Tax=Buchnera aphidicola TaxID=9 RepID=UPI00094CD2AF|nr:ribosome biogenesis GTPase Der [Buchnera aphidicola]